MFVVATERDHVSPWTSVYKVCASRTRRSRFLLTSGGHNVGIVNPPAAPARIPRPATASRRTRPRKAPADPQAWQEAASQTAGSWWPCWQQWLRRHSSGKLKARPVVGLQEAGAPLLAPGTYVHQR